MNAKNVNDPADLERNGENIRADMDETLDALQEKLSPGRAMDRSMQFLRDHGSEISREITSAVREHPVPLLLTAVGLTWLATSVLRSRSSSASRTEFLDDDSDYEPSEYEYDYDYGYAQTVGVGEGFRARASEMKRHASERLHSAMDSARGRSRQMNNQLHDLVREQPLALGALAMAAGAIAGALLPATEYERQTMRPLRDRAVARAEEIGERSYDQVKSALRSNGEQQGRGDQTRAG